MNQGKEAKHQGTHHSPTDNPPREHSHEHCGCSEQQGHRQSGQDHSCESSYGCDHTGHDGHQLKSDDHTCNGHLHAHACAADEGHSHDNGCSHGHSDEHGPGLVISRAEYLPSGSVRGARRTTFRVVDLDCPDCARKVHRAATAVSGVISADLLFASRKLIVEHTGEPHPIIDAVSRVGETLRIEDDSAVENRGVFSNIRARLTLLSGTLLLAAVIAEKMLGLPVVVPRLLYSGAVISGGYIPALSGMKAAFNGFSFNMNFLMTLAVTGAVAIGEWLEASTVVFLFSLGNALESYTLDRTTRSIRELMSLTPPVAIVRRHGLEQSVPVADLQSGDTILISPGARIAADALVTSGESAVNQAPITGESVPEWKSPGKEVFAGSINGSGYLEARVLRAAQHSTIAKIVRLVEQAQAKKSPVERFVDRFSRHYTPIVIALAFAVAVIPPALGAPFAPWFYRALSLLVVSCPCALVISTPVSIAAAISNAASHGVLVKGGAYIEQMGALKAIAFDKTGTVTTGKPKVTDIWAAPSKTEDEILSIAAMVEHRSEHPFARAVVDEALRRNILYEVPSSFQAILGKGARASTHLGEFWVLTPDAALEMNVSLSYAQHTIARLQREGKTVSVVTDGSAALGVIAVRDTLRSEARETVERLYRAGITRVAMLTGDNEATALALAGEAGIKEVHAGLLPEHKVEVVQQMAKDGKVAMVGDGINDAPALAAADIGIAMGVAGTDVALETADVALMGDDLRKLPFAIDLSRRTMHIVRQNIGFSLVVKLAAVALVFPGLLTLWLAIAADTGAALIVILNGMRLLATRHKHIPPGR